jgi:hypothetical protein
MGCAIVKDKKQNSTWEEVRLLNEEKLKEREKLIDRLEGKTGLYEDWSSISTRGLKKLLYMLINS